MSLIASRTRTEQQFHDGQAAEPYIIEKVELAHEKGAFYLDTCVEPWPGGYEWDELVGWSVLEQPPGLVAGERGCGQARLRGLDLQWPVADFDVSAETARLAAEAPVR